MIRYFKEKQNWCGSRQKKQHPLLSKRKRTKPKAKPIMDDDDWREEEREKKIK